MAAVVREKSAMPARLQAPANAVLIRLPAESVVGALGPLVGHPIRPAEHFALTVRQVRQRDNDPVVQWDATGLAVLCLRKDDVARARSTSRQSSHSASPTRAPV